MQHQQQAKDEPDTKGAEHASIDLGFCVTPANFTAARQARNLEKTKPIAPPTTEERLQNAESEIILLRAQLTDFNQWNRMKWEDLSQISSAIKSRLRILEQATFAPPCDPLFPASPLKSEIPDPQILPDSSDIECPTPSGKLRTANNPTVNYLSICSGIEAATQAWHPLGNSMAVPVMHWIGHRLQAHLSQV